MLSNTVKCIVLVVSDTQHPPFIKYLIEKKLCLLMVNSINTLFTIVGLLVINGYIQITMMALHHILAYLQLVLLLMYSLTQTEGSRNT